MFEYMIIFCVVSSLGKNTEAVCDSHTAGNYVSKSACIRQGRLRESRLRFLHRERYGGGAPVFIADYVCNEHDL